MRRGPGKSGLRLGAAAAQAVTAIGGNSRDSNLARLSRGCGQPAPCLFSLDISHALYGMM
jgi:hypothetical protein